MIKIFLGNVGSGKTACAVREMYLNHERVHTYGNIITTIANCHTISPDMIIKKTQVDTIKKRDGTLEPVYKHELNVEFWQDAVKKHAPISVILDEAHTIVNARRSMSKINVIVTDWLALVRRVLGSAGSSHGELLFISQLHNRIDVIAREMANQVRYHVCHYKKNCKNCMSRWSESSETPEPRWVCGRCGSYDINKHSHVIEVWHFRNMANYDAFKQYGMATFYRHYLVNDIEMYFPMYDTLQWDNLFSTAYE